MQQLNNSFFSKIPDILLLMLLLFMGACTNIVADKPHPAPPQEEEKLTI